MAWRECFSPVNRSLTTANRPDHAHHPAIADQHVSSVGGQAATAMNINPQPQPCGHGHNLDVSKQQSRRAGARRQPQSTLPRDTAPICLSCKLQRPTCTSSIRPNSAGLRVPVPVRRACLATRRAVLSRAAIRPAAARYPSPCNHHDHADSAKRKNKGKRRNYVSRDVCWEIRKSEQADHSRLVAHPPGVLLAWSTTYVNAT